ncbi:MAG TPA: ABC transporter ATP-binding protein [Negativicutes bacterium]|nr:ABC transporter ATP-binding protein [Negativicutes bacterium]
MESKNLAIDINNATVRFNMATECIFSIKEYFVKLVKGQLMFQEFFALQEVSLQVEKGDSWGFVGTNGAGKSTLLKLICGILKPYKGTVQVYGSIAPLIELGAGFDPEMTARENIFLNGAILGHTKIFMSEHLDEIVDFAELREFLDVPIKNFSSGMTARLGFSIATMVQPEILVVDEILAVGDYAFQQKCHARMENMLKGGTTLLFVSHSVEQVRALCKHALWLEKGRVVMSGESTEVCDAYMTSKQ